MSATVPVWIVHCVSHKDGRIDKVCINKEGVAAVLDNKTCYTRQEALDLIENKVAQLETTCLDAKGQPRKGAKVERVQIGKEWFLKTEPNDTKDDNLGDLPECDDC